MNARTVGHPDRDTLAAYCLGGLEVDETAAYDAHLASCPSCREYAAELTAVRDMLSLVPASLVLDDPTLAGDLPPAPAPISGHRPRPAAREPERRSAAWYQRPWLPVAAIAAAIVVGAFVIPNVVDGSGGQAGPRPTATGGATGVVIAGQSTSVTASLTIYPGATASTFKAHLTGVTAPIQLNVVVDLLNGSTLNAGTWSVPAGASGQPVELDGTAQTAVGDMKDLRVLLPSGTVLVTFNVTH